MPVPEKEDGVGICDRFLVPYNEKLYACDLDQLDPDAMGRFFPHAEVADIIRNMKRADNACTLMGYQGQGHGFYIRGEPRYYAIVLREADKFLAGLGWLTGEPTLPEPR